MMSERTGTLDPVRKVAVLGSTGSIGTATLNVLEQLGGFQLKLISCHRSLSLFDEQCHRHRPDVAVVTGPIDEGIRNWLAADSGTRSSPPVRHEHGADRLVEWVRSDSIDTVVAAIVGIAGLETSLAAAETGKRLALANKEALVVAGQLLLDAAQKSRAEIIPIDSEHSAVFQALQCGRTGDEVERVVLTASGGPLRDWPLDRLSEATVEDALAHPTWNMGRKITVDSATMMNKALEVIEARWLFDLCPDQIAVVIHPQSIIHSMVEFRDGSVISQMSPPDMRLPIQYALTYPTRSRSCAHRFDWTDEHHLEWYPVDPERYPALELGYEVARRGGTCGAVLNAANEAAVELFLQNKIRLTDIVTICRTVLDSHHYSPSPTLRELMQLDRWSRDEVSRWTKIPC